MLLKRVLTVHVVRGFKPLYNRHILKVVYERFEGRPRKKKPRVFSVLTYVQGNSHERYISQTVTNIRK